MFNDRDDIKNEFTAQMELIYEALKENEKWTILASEALSFEEIWDESRLGRLMLYYLSHEISAPEDRVDCDSSYTAMAAHIEQNYRILSEGNAVKLLPQEYSGKKSNNKFYININDEIYYGDTLTSMWQPLRLWITDPAVYEDVYSEESRLLILDGSRYRIPENKCRDLRKSLGRNITNRGIWAAFILLNLKHFDKLMTEDIQKALEGYHTEKNFLLVPQFFNTGSSGKFACNDFADLKLRAICRFFETRDTAYLANLFTDVEVKSFIAGKWILDYRKTEVRKKQTLEKALVWLKKFNDWDDFVKANRLLRYVDEEGKPEELWKDHEYGEIPDKEKLIQLFENLAWILDQ